MVTRDNNGSLSWQTFPEFRNLNFRFAQNRLNQIPKSEITVVCRSRALFSLSSVRLRRVLVVRCLTYPASRPSRALVPLLSPSAPPSFWQHGARPSPLAVWNSHQPCRRRLLSSSLEAR